MIHRMSRQSGFGISSFLRFIDFSVPNVLMCLLLVVFFTLFSTGEHMYLWNKRYTNVNNNSTNNNNNNVALPILHCICILLTLVKFILKV